MILTIARHEWKRYTRTPMIWLAGAISLFLLAYMFLSFSEHFINVVQLENASQQQQTGVSDAVVAPTLLWAGMLGLGLMPLIGMRGFAEERQLKTRPLLCSSAVPPLHWLLGKYLGVVALISVYVLLASLMPLSLGLGTTLDYGKLLSGSFGVWLLLSSFAAAALYCSTLSRSSTSTALLTFGLLLLFTVLYVGTGSSERSSNTLYALAHFGHLPRLLQGRFNLADVGYYLVFATSFLWLAWRRLAAETRREHR